MNEHTTHYVDGAAQALIDNYSGNTTPNPWIWESWAFHEWQRGYDTESLQNVLRDKRNA